MCVFLTDLPGSDLSLPPHLRNLLHFILKCRAHYCLSSVTPGPGLHPSCCHWRHLTEILFNGDEIFIVFPHFKSHGALVGTRRLNWHALASDVKQKDESRVMIQQQHLLYGGAENLPRHHWHNQNIESMLRLFRSVEIGSFPKCFCFIHYYL